MPEVKDQLSYMDQGSLLAMRSSGHGLLVHLTWLFDEPVDVPGLKAFVDRLDHGLIGRLIEPSPLPWGRHRWVSLSRSTQIDEFTDPRPRSAVRPWVSEVAALPIDPVTGPGFRVGVVPLDDGGSAVTLVVSHTIADALGMTTAAVTAAEGRTLDLRLEPRGSRPRFATLLADLVDSIRRLPASARAALALIEMTRNAAKPQQLPPAVKSSDNEPLGIPAEAMWRIDAADWAASATRRGGNTVTLFGAIAARIGQRLGRVRPDGNVTLVLPVSRRTENDTRANALSSMTLVVDADTVVDDLSGLRNAIREGFKAAQTPTPEERSLPLVPWVPAGLLRRLESSAIDAANLPTGCSSLGTMPPALAHIDGVHEADVHTWLAEVPQKLSQLERLGGKLFVVFAQFADTIHVSATAHLPGAENTEDAIRAVGDAVLAEFGLPSIPA